MLQRAAIDICYAAGQVLRRCRPRPRVLHVGGAERLICAAGPIVPLYVRTAVTAIAGMLAPPHTWPLEVVPQSDCLGRWMVSCASTLPGPGVAVGAGDVVFPGTQLTPRQRYVGPTA